VARSCGVFVFLPRAASSRSICGRSCGKPLCVGKIHPQLLCMCNGSWSLRRLLLCKRAAMTSRPRCSGRRRGEPRLSLVAGCRRRLGLVCLCLTIRYQGLDPQSRYLPPDCFVKKTKKNALFSGSLPLPSPPYVHSLAWTTTCPNAHHSLCAFALSFGLPSFCVFSQPALALCRSPLNSHYH